MKRIRVGIAFTCFAAILMLSACGSKTAPTGGGDQKTPSPAAASTTVVVSVWGGVHEEVLREYLEKPLKAQGIEVQFVLGQSGDREAKLRAEAGKPTTDVILMPIVNAVRLIEEGIAEKADPAAVADLPLVKDSVDPNVGYPVSVLELGLRYNPKKIEKPTSWKDLWNAKYKGHVAFGEYPRAAQGILGVAMANEMFGKSPTDADAGFKALAQLKPFALVFGNEDQMDSVWNSQDIWISPSIRGYTYAFKEKGGEVEYVVPKEGAIRMANVGLIPKNAPHRDAAIKAMRVLLSKDVQTSYANKAGFGSVNTEVKLSGSVAQTVPNAAEIAKEKTYPWAELVKNLKPWTDLWNRTLN